jgi:hypothetical protein
MKELNENTQYTFGELQSLVVLDRAFDLGYIFIV